MVSSFLLGRHKRKGNDKFWRDLWDVPPVILKISYKKLFEATDGFSSTNLIGVGSFGSVYKGILRGEIVAVKVLNNQRQGASKSFMAECEALGIIRHRYLVSLITACSTIDFKGKDFKALIYKFMPNGNLGRWLHSSPESNALNLRQRINIAIEVALALQYLHHNCSKTIIHCDLKPSNILLDKDMVAHIGDLGLAKFLPEFPDLNQRNSNRTRGTTGYAAPEYGSGSEASIGGDIYSYGILLLEMMTGKKPNDPIFEDGLDHHSFSKVVLPGIILLEVLTGNRPILEDDLDLHRFASRALPDQVMDIVDPVLLKDVEEGLTLECLISMVRIGVSCSMESPHDRMDIKNVIQELYLIRDIIQGTQKPPTRKRPILDLRMSWLPNFEKSNHQEEPKSCSQGDTWFPNFEDSYYQEESESYSQGESWLPNFEKSYCLEELQPPNVENPCISSNEHEIPSETQILFPNPIPLLPIPIPWESPPWVSFEKSQTQVKLFSIPLLPKPVPWGGRQVISKFE